MRLLALILTWFLTIGGSLAKAGDDIAYARDWPADAQTMRNKGTVLLVIFTRPDCPYCDRLMAEYLIPMQRNKSYQTRVLMRQIEVGGEDPLIDFSGKPITHAQFAARSRAALTPTIKLFDASGVELSNPIIGYTTPDLYGGYLDQAIDEAYLKSRQRSRTAALSQ